MSELLLFQLRQIKSISINIYREKVPLIALLITVMTWPGRIHNRGPHMCEVKQSMILNSASQFNSEMLYSISLGLRKLYWYSLVVLLLWPLLISENYFPPHSCRQNSQQIARRIKNDGKICYTSFIISKLSYGNRNKHMHSILWLYKLCLVIKVCYSSSKSVLIRSEFEWTII